MQRMETKMTSGTDKINVQQIENMQKSNTEKFFRKESCPLKPRRIYSKHLWWSLFLRIVASERLFLHLFIQFEMTAVCLNKKEKLYVKNRVIHHIMNCNFTIISWYNLMEMYFFQKVSDDLFETLRRLRFHEISAPENQVKLRYFKQ